MNERLSYIDFLKGIAIIFVLLLHTLSDGVRSAIIAQVHIGQAVPIFLTVTIFLSFLTMERLDDRISKWFEWIRIWRMFKRIILPFAIVLLIQCLILVYRTDFQPITILAGGARSRLLLYLGISSNMAFGSVCL